MQELSLYISVNSKLKNPEITSSVRCARVKRKAGIGPMEKIIYNNVSTYCNDWQMRLGTT